MLYIRLFHKFNEDTNLYKSFKKVSPLKQGEMELVDRKEPIEGGVVLIISKPFADMYRRIYMAVINHVRKDNETTTTRVDVINQFSILKLHSDGNIYPEKCTMSDIKRYEILGMKNTGLYMHFNKTPLWEISCGLNKVKFFGNPEYQAMIKELPKQYKNVVFPPTQLNNKPNLHL